MRLNKTLFAAMAVAGASLVPAMGAQAQTFTPVPVTGFTRDVIAETLPATGSTTASLDAPANDFVFLADGSPSALPSSGLVTAPGRSYQLASFTASNAIHLQVGNTALLTLTTPAYFEQVSLLGLATEGSHNISIQVVFEGGTTQPAVTRNLRDWSEATDAIGGDFARVQRGTDLIQTPYRVFAVDVPIRTEDLWRRVSAVRITNAEPFGFSRSNIMAVSGVVNASPPPPPPPAPVPTMSEWAMIVLSGLLLAFGAGQAMRTRRA